MWLQQLPAAEHVPVQPGRRGFEVTALSVEQARLVDVAQPGGKARSRRRGVVGLGAEHAEVALRGAPHREVWLGLEARAVLAATAGWKRSRAETAASKWPTASGVPVRATP